MADSCVAASICIVLLARGDACDEIALHQQGGGWNLTGRVLEVLGGEPKADRFDQLESLDVRLAAGYWAIARIHGPRYLLRMGDRPGGHPSQHGAMCEAAEIGTHPTHAIVLIGKEREHYRYLDPYYPADGQPLSMPTEIFQYVFTGEAVFVSPRREGA